MTDTRRHRTHRHPRTDNRFVPITLLGSTVLMPRPASYEPMTGDGRVRFPTGRIT